MPEEAAVLEVPAVETPVEEPKTPVEGPSVETAPVQETEPEATTAAPVGLDLEDDKPPVFGLDGKFVGGKFVGKYDTLDDALIGHKNALKRIGQLEYELSQTRDGGGDQAVSIPVADPEFLTPEMLEVMVDKVLGDSDEMTFEQRVEFEENPVRYVARENVKRETVREQIRGKAQSVVGATKAAYSKVWDQAQPHGMRVWNDVLSGAMSLPEARILLGLGLMAREGLLSGNEPVTKRVPTGRAPETTAAVPAPARTPSDPRGEQKEAFRRMQKAAYG